MHRICSQICGSTIRHPWLIIASMLSAALFLLALHNNIVVSLSARLNLLDKQPIFRLLCPSPQFSRVSLPATGLASFPGSGNTLLRYLIQEATGILTGSEYNDTWLFHGSFPGEGNTSTSTIFVKTHGSDYRTQQKYSRVVLLVRDPKDALLAAFHLYLGAGHYSVAAEKAFKQHWRTFLEINAEVWRGFHNDWLSYKNPVLLVTYEDLVSNPETEVRRISEFLQIPITNRGLICGMNTSKRFHRRKFTPPITLYKQKMSTYLDNLYNNTLQQMKTQFVHMQ